MRIIILLIISVIMVSACVTVPSGEKLTRDKKLKLAEARTISGIAYLKAGKFNIAFQDFQLALRMNPRHSMANNYMAVLKWRYKEYEEAEKYFRKAIGYDPENATAFNNYGSFLCARGKIDKAIDAYKRAIANPAYINTAYANENAGICLMKKPAPAEAEKFFRDALAAIPRLPKSLYFMASITYHTGRTLSARGFLQRYMEISRKKPTPEALLLAVKIERVAGHGDRAASYAFRLRNLYPDSNETRELKKIR